jgi:polyribonucleotide nucleotidyltransferase
MQQKVYSIEIGSKMLSAEFNDLADQASGSVLMRYGETAVMVTACMGTKDKELDYFPLSVEFEERFYAVGAILGSQFVRREGKPSDEATLAGRIVDRTIRPLFEDHIRRDVQVICTVLALGADDADIPAVIGASLALATSNIPWKGPVSAVRLGKEGDAFVINPIYAQRVDETLDLLVCGRDNTINMVEVSATELSEDDIATGMELANITLMQLQKWQEGIVAERGVTKEVFVKKEWSVEMVALFKEVVEPVAQQYIFTGSAGKEGMKTLAGIWAAAVSEKIPTFSKEADKYLDSRINDYIHEGALKSDKRVDGRKMDEIRPLFAQAGGISPLLHGSGVFYRGGTHVFTALTLGGPGDAQTVDSIEHRDFKKGFIHHYNFPPYSVGETGRVGGTNRRMIGHGNLAEKAVRPMLPNKDVFPYTIRLVSECFASNGSTSMASTCASTLALMDGGVPLKRPVAGIAMGLMTDGKVYKVLTDIQGPEDHHGDMDFKVAGTREGITAVQMDVKIDGAPLRALKEALQHAKVARLKILDVMEAAIAAPRADISVRAPKIITLKIKVDQIGSVIGSGGKIINGIKDKTGVSDITIEDDGSIFITGTGESTSLARTAIEAIVHEYKAGEVYEGEVMRILDFGAFVRLRGDTEGLVHVSEFAEFRIGSAQEAVTIGEKVKVIIKEIDEKGRVNLSIKDIDPEFATRKALKPTLDNGPTRNTDRPSFRPHGGDRRRPPERGGGNSFRI